MKILQNIVLSAVIATSMVSFSTAVMANEKKEVASAQDLIKTTISHIEAAIAAVTANEKTEVVLAHIKEARQTQKDIIIGALDQDRQKASSKLVNAIRDLKAGKTQEGKTSLEEALAAFKDLETKAAGK